MEIKFNNVSCDYQFGPVRTPRVLHQIALTIPIRSFTAIIGHTGAGKSSLLKTMNGLLLPKEGSVTIGDMIIEQNTDKKTLKKVHKKVGMVLQFPESQLFAETVEKDICFGPLNYGIAWENAKMVAKQVIRKVGLDESVLKKSPFSLSGGEKRRVAIAGILALEPEILVLDEPGAGLDPEGKQEIFSLLSNWHEEQDLTILFVTHDMEDVARYAKDVIVMDKGTIAFYGPMRNFFANREEAKKWRNGLPSAYRFQLQLEEKMGKRLPKVCLTEEELADVLIEVGLV